VKTYLNLNQSKINTMQQLEITKGKLLQVSHGGKFQLWRYKRVEYVLYVSNATYMTRRQDEIISKRLELTPVFN
jgi:hypothetical protein